MGAWGTGIFDDDTTCDVKDSFIEYLKEGHTPHEATELILEEYLDEFDSEEDLDVLSLVYIGLSATQMKKKCLQEQVRKTTIDLIERGADLELWEDADPKDYEKRKKILKEFKEKLIQF
ncbi:DUF4259 domain-containing protein [Bacillus salipaludis]|uniref:DUF4259 domain-containing protein n=1 Tax=Bacillus salipaludis TaxID=2547811 RepID=UPI002E1F7FED|nr:DUF4259 domain-containing protein [Bacillus salipaludis]